MIVHAIAAAVVALLPWAPPTRSGPWIGIVFEGERNHPIPNIWVSDHELPQTSDKSEVPFIHFANKFFVLSPAAYSSFAAAVQAVRCPDRMIDVHRDNRIVGIGLSDGSRQEGVCESQGVPACANLLALAQAAGLAGSPDLRDAIVGMDYSIDCRRP